MSDPNICIVHPNPGPQCETFIRAHIDRLPGVASVLHGGHMPLYDMNGRELHPGLPQDFRQLFSPDGKQRTAQHEKAAKNIADHLEASNIQVALAEYGPTGVAMMEPCEAKHIPLVTYFFGYDAFERPVTDKYAEGYSRLFRRADRLLGVSGSILERLRSMGAPETRMSRIVCGVDTKIFSATDPSCNTPLFTTMSRFVDKKGPHLSLLAFSEAAKKAPEIRLCMIGDGPLLDSCRAVSKALGIEDFVEFPGRLSPGDARRILGKSRCFLQHSITAPNGDSEGTPVAILEASAMGLPVVSTRHSGIPDIVHHEETGLLCDPFDIETMAEHIVRLALEPETALRFGQKGREFVRTHCDLQKTVGQLHCELIRVVMKDAAA